MSGTWLADWATNDVVTAAEFRKGVGCVYDSTLSGSVASIDVTGIPTTYAHLLIVAYLRTDVAATQASPLLRFNNDSGANYDYQITQAIGATVAGVQSFAATSITTFSCPGNTAPANAFGVLEILIPHYGNAANHKSAKIVSGSKGGTTAGTIRDEMSSGFWRSTAAINRVTIVGDGNFVSGSRLGVYVMGS